MKLKAKPKSKEIVNITEPVRVDMVDDNGVVHKNTCTRTSFGGIVENHNDTINQEGTEKPGVTETHTVFPIETSSAYSVEHSNCKRMRIDHSGSECFDEEWKTKSVAYCCVLGLLICQNNFSHLNDEILHMMESYTQVLINSWLKCPESIDTKLCSPTYYKFGNMFFCCEAKYDVIQCYCYRSSE